MSKRKAADQIDALIALVIAFNLVTTPPAPSREVRYTDLRADPGFGEALRLGEVVTGPNADKYRDREVSSLEPSRGRPRGW